MRLFEFYPDISTDKLSGGKGDGALPSHTDTAELALGVQIESEHTDDPDIATEIATDHLTEDPKYYSKLISAGLSDEFPSMVNSGLGDPNAPLNKVSKIGNDVTYCKPGNNIGKITKTSDGNIPGRSDKPIVDKSISEIKSDTTYGDYAKIAQRVIDALMVMARKTPKNFTEAEKMITPSFVKSVLLGLGQSHPELSEKLTSLAAIARKPKF
jgi:hypothetical protein